MEIGIVGFGLIGGSLARAFKAAGATIYGYDIRESVLTTARRQGCCDAMLDETRLPDCDYIFLAVPAPAAEDWLLVHAKALAAQKRQPLILDCCGVKRHICALGFRLEEELGIRFIGAHPMAGNERWGFQHSRADLFKGATCVLVLSERDRRQPGLLQQVEALWKLAGFARCSLMTAEEHDATVAYTSQLSHLVSSSFVKCRAPFLQDVRVAGGSFRDMTRVAFLNERLWADLFTENRDKLLPTLDALLKELQEYREALEQEDYGRLTALLAEGRHCKEEMNALSPAQA